METFSFITPLELKENEWITGLINLDKFDSVFNINEKISKSN